MARQSSAPGPLYVWRRGRLATLLAFTALLTYKTYEAVRGLERGAHSNRRHTNETVLLEDVRADYLNEWLAVSSAPGAVDGSFARASTAPATVSKRPSGARE